MISTAQPLFRRAATLALTCALAFTLAACGRRGPLDPPPSSLTDTPAPVAQTTSPVPAVFGASSQNEPLPNAVAPRRRIFLDGLLN